MSVLATAPQNMRRAVIVLAAALAGHASAFTASPTVMQRSGRAPAVCTQAPRTLVALRNQIDQADVAKLTDAGMSEADAVMVLGQGKTVKEALDLLEIAFMRREAMGSAGGFFKSWVDVEGEYTDDGWVEEKKPAPATGGKFSDPPPKSGGLFGGLFGGANKASIKAQEELDKQLNVITYEDGTQVIKCF